MFYFLLGIFIGLYLGYGAGYGHFFVLHIKLEDGSLVRSFEKSTPSDVDVPFSGSEKILKFLAIGFFTVAWPYIFYTTKI
jgi:hypothetical protein